MRNRVGAVALVGLAVASGASPAAAQYSSLAAPLGTGGDGFFEHVGMGFSFSGPGFFFQQNGLGAAAPPFGSFAPGAGLGGGVAFGFGGGQGQLSFVFEQGSRRSLASAAPGVTLANGAWSGFFDTSQTPFVVGVVPIVGDEPARATPLAERLDRLRHEPRGDATTSARADKPAGSSARSHAGSAADSSSSAARPVGSLAEMRQKRAAELAALVAEADELAAKAERALAAGKPGLAKLYFQQAARRADGEARRDLEQRAHAAGQLRSATAKRGGHERE